MYYTFYWLDGSISRLKGDNVEKAFGSAYGGGAINAVDWYEEGWVDSHFFIRSGEGELKRGWHKKQPYLIPGSGIELTVAKEVFSDKTTSGLKYVRKHNFNGTDLDHTFELYYEVNVIVEDVMVKTLTIRRRVQNVDTCEITVDDKFHYRLEDFEIAVNDFNAFVSNGDVPINNATIEEISKTQIFLG